MQVFAKHSDDAVSSAAAGAGQSDTCTLLWRDARTGDVREIVAKKPDPERGELGMIEVYRFQEYARRVYRVLSFTSDGRRSLGRTFGSAAAPTGLAPWDNALARHPSRVLHFRLGDIMAGPEEVPGVEIVRCRHEPGCGVPVRASWVPSALMQGAVPGALLRGDVQWWRIDSSDGIEDPMAAAAASAASASSPPQVVLVGEPKSSAYVSSAAEAASDLMAGAEEVLPGAVYEIHLSRSTGSEAVEAHVLEVPVYAGTPWHGAVQVIANALYGESHRAQVRSLGRQLQRVGVSAAEAVLRDPNCKLPRILVAPQSVGSDADLAKVLRIVARVENAGFVLPWASLPIEMLQRRVVEGTAPIAADAQGPGAGNSPSGGSPCAPILGPMSLAGLVARGELVPLACVELPRLRTGLLPSRSADGSLVLRLSDRTSMFLLDGAESGEEPSAALDALSPQKLLRGLPQSLVLQNDQSELFVFVPSHPMLRPSITGHPFTTYV